MLHRFLFEDVKNGANKPVLEFGRQHLTNSSIYNYKSKQHLENKGILKIEKWLYCRNFQNCKREQQFCIRWISKQRGNLINLTTKVNGYVKM